MTTFIVIPKPAYAAGLLESTRGGAPTRKDRVEAVHRLLDGTRAGKGGVMAAEGMLEASGDVAEPDAARATELAREAGSPRLLESVNAVLVDDLDEDERGLLAERADVVENHDILLVEPTAREDGGGGDRAWHIEDTGAEHAWGQEPSLRGGGVRIGILDTGIAAEHPEFDGKDISFMDFDESGFPLFSTPRDYDEHGTHVAAIAAGASRGIAPDAQLAVAAVLTKRTADGMSGTLAQILGGYEWLAVNIHGSDPSLAVCPVINASLGAPGYYGYLRGSVQNQLTRTASVLVAAIGNAGRDGVNRHSSPGNYDLTLGIGATDRDGMVADFSDWGFEGTHGAYKPDLCAPGVRIDSAVPGGGYRRFSGTSMATPAVAGAAALLVSKDRSLARDPYGLMHELRQLVDTSKNGEPGNSGAGLSRIGAGRLDLSRL